MILWLLAAIGLAHCVMYAAGIFVPGLTYHCMFGGDRQVNEWHKLHSEDLNERKFR